MTPPESPSVVLDDLLDHASWLQGLARNLVGDEATADDLVQETWVAAIKKPPRDTDRPRSWMRSVVRRLAARNHRQRFRRSARERAVSIPEATGDAQDLVVRAEMQRQVASEVLRLEEPARSTILLRFYEDLRPDEIAKRMAVPVATVHTRLRRAIEQVRQRLDHIHAGDRGTWCALLAPLALVESSVKTTATATTSAAVATGSTMAVGGIIMAKGTAIAALVVGSVALTIGILVGNGMSTEDVLEERLAKKDSAYQTLLEERNRYAEQLDARVTEMAEANRLWAEQKSALDVEIAHLEAAAAAAKLPVEELFDDSLPISFGEFGRIEALRDADWVMLAKAIQKIDVEVVKLAEALAKDESPDPGLQMKIMTAQGELQAYALQIIGKLPTNHSGNGEFSHPVSVANLVDAYLENGELPLDTNQRRAIAEFGNEYTEVFADRNASYTEQTWMLEKFIDEIELKHNFVNQMYGTLDEEQYNVVVNPATSGRAGLDTFSPGVMLQMTSAPISADSREDLRGSLINKISTQLGYDKERLQELPLFDSWIEDVDAILTPQARGLHSIYKVDEATIAGRAQLKALIALADELQLSDEERNKLQQLKYILVPRINPTE